MHLASLGTSAHMSVARVRRKVAGEGGCAPAKPHARRAALPGRTFRPFRQSGRSSGVEHNLAKVGVEGSNPFARSSETKQKQCFKRKSRRELSLSVVAG